MNKKNENGSGTIFPGGVLDSVLTVGKTMITELDNLSHTARLDGMCGSWTAPARNAALLVRKSLDGGYTAMLCDTSRCYKVFRKNIHILVRRDKTYFRTDNGSQKLEPVMWDPCGKLTLGFYGEFYPEESEILDQYYREKENENQ